MPETGNVIYLQLKDLKIKSMCVLCLLFAEILWHSGALVEKSRVMKCTHQFYLLSTEHALNWKCEWLQSVFKYSG